MEHHSEGMGSRMVCDPSSSTDTADLIKNSVANKSVCSYKDSPRFKIYEPSFKKLVLSRTSLTLSLRKNGATVSITFSNWQRNGTTVDESYFLLSCSMTS